MDVCSWILNRYYRIHPPRLARFLSLGDVSIEEADAVLELL